MIRLCVFVQLEAPCQPSPGGPQSSSCPLAVTARALPVATESTAFCVVTGLRLRFCEFRSCGLFPGLQLCERRRRRRRLRRIQPARVKKGARLLDKQPRMLQHSRFRLAFLPSVICLPLYFYFLDIVCICLSPLLSGAALEMEAATAA